MDNDPIRHSSEEDAERAALQAAVDQARRDTGPPIPNEVMLEKMYKKREELRIRIAALDAE